MGRSSRTKRDERARAAVSPALQAGQSPPSRGRRIALWLVVLALPAALLGGVELVLRATGFGHDLEPLFISSPQQPAYLQANPRVVTRFFTDPGHGRHLYVPVQARQRHGGRVDRHGAVTTRG